MLKTYRIIPLVFILFLFGFTLITVAPVFAHGKGDYRTTEQLIKRIQKLEAAVSRLGGQTEAPAQSNFPGGQTVPPVVEQPTLTPVPSKIDGPWDPSMGMRHPARPCMKSNICGADRRSPEQKASDPYDTNNPVSLAARGESGGDMSALAAMKLHQAAVADGPWDISMGMRHPNRPRMKWEDAWGRWYEEGVWRSGPDGRECTVCDPSYKLHGTKHFIEDWNACGPMSAHWGRSISGMDGEGNKRKKCVEKGVRDERICRGEGQMVRQGRGFKAPDRDMGCEIVCTRYEKIGLTSKELQQVFETCLSDRAKGCRGEYFRTGVIANNHRGVATQCERRGFHNFGKTGAYGKTWWLYPPK